MNSILRSSLLRSTLRFSEGMPLRNAVHIVPASKINITYPALAICTQKRFFSDNNDEIHTKKLPQLMDFPPLVWPSIIKYIKNWIFVNFIIRPYFEKEFNMPEFIEASKHAVEVVSDALQRGDYKTLEGLVVKEALNELKSAVSKMSVQQRQMLSIDREDIFYTVPYQVGVMFDDADKRWVEITMCYHVLLGFKKLKDTNELPAMNFGFKPEFKEKLFILNYRFIREFTKGVEDSWWINIVNHFQPHLLGREL